MMLYHGTSYNKLQKILTNGITPRGRNKTNWKENPSNPEMVYLSVAYPFYFSYVASNGNNSPLSLVFEIDIDRLPYKNLYPDEDFILQAMDKKEGPTLKKIREDIECYRKHFQKSLKGLGNICYKGIIPIECITRYCVVDFEKRVHLSMEVMDPTISIINYQIIGDKYRDLISWFFGDSKMLPAVKKNKEYMNMIEKDYSHMKMLLQQGIDFWEKESQNREGVEVFSV